MWEPKSWSGNVREFSRRHGWKHRLGGMLLESEDSLPGRQTGRARDHSQMIKVAHLQDGLLLPHPPDLGQKPGSFKQKPVSSPPLPPTGRPLLMDWLNKAGSSPV